MGFRELLRLEAILGASKSDTVGHLKLGLLTFKCLKDGTNCEVVKEASSSSLNDRKLFL